MTRSLPRILGLLVFAAFLAGNPVRAQQSEPPLNCEEPMDQSSMTQCAYLAWETADKELNTVWKTAIKDARDADAEMKSYGSDDGRPGYEDTLLKAQRAWIAFRDAHCEYSGFEARGGSMEPMLVGICLEQLTLERTMQLKTESGEQ